MGRLRRHVEGLADFNPRPLRVERSINGLAFERRGAASKCDDRSEGFGGIIGGGNADGFGHAINLG